MEAEKPISNGGAQLPSLLPPFLTKCYDMVEDPATNDTVCWGDSDNTFIIKDQHAFSRDLLPKYFKHSNISSFIRQLNTYGFRKVDHDKWVFKNGGFVRGQKDLLKSITRKKSSQNIVNPPPESQGKHSIAVKAVEVGEFGLDEEIERLKRDKNLLKQELVKVRQHQQNTDHEVHELRKRLQAMERNQQQMLSFLAMAVQNPSFWAQMAQQNMNNKWRSDINKKRRLPALEGAMDCYDSCDKQMIKYQPHVVETSELYVEQVSNSDTSNLANGVHGLCAYVDSMSIGKKSSMEVEGEAVLSDFSDYLEKLLASPVPDNNGQIDQVFFDIPDFIFDFDLPQQDVEMEKSENTISSDV